MVNPRIEKNFCINLLEVDKEWVQEMTQKSPEWLNLRFPAEGYFDEAIAILKNPEEHPTISRNAKKYIVSFQEADLHYYEKIYRWALKSRPVVTRIWSTMGANRRAKWQIVQMIEFFKAYPELK